MGKKEGLQDPVRHQNIYRKRRSPYTQRPRKQTSHNLVWMPKVPSWEKEFCYRIGLFRWENFLEAKKLTGFAHKILEWNDSAAEEAFHRTKNRFFAMINGLPNPDESNIPSPDLYIDEIDWDDDDDDDDKVNSEVFDGLELARGESSEEEEEEKKEKENENRDYVPDYYHIRIEDIKPTGWDFDTEEI